LKNLIINAVDFGLTPSVTPGIIESFKNGIVTSMLAGDIEKIIILYKSHPDKEERQL